MRRSKWSRRNIKNNMLTHTRAIWWWLDDDPSAMRIMIRKVSGTVTALERKWLKRQSSVEKHMQINYRKSVSHIPLLLITHWRIGWCDDAAIRRAHTHKWIYIRSVTIFLTLIRHIRRWRASDFVSLFLTHNFYSILCFDFDSVFVRLFLSSANVYVFKFFRNEIGENLFCKSISHQQQCQRMDRKTPLK